MRVTDRQTDRQTDGRTDGQHYDSHDRPRICSRGKKWKHFVRAECECRPILSAIPESDPEGVLAKHVSSEHGIQRLKWCLVAASSASLSASHVCQHCFAEVWSSRRQSTALLARFLPVYTADTTDDERSVCWRSRDQTEINVSLRLWHIGGIHPSSFSSLSNCFDRNDLARLLCEVRRSRN